MSKLVAARARKLGLTDCEDEDIKRIVKGHSKYHVLSFVRVCCNATTTTWRMNEPLRHSCLFGCPDSLDNMRHYVSCPCLHAIVPFCKVGGHHMKSWFHPNLLSLVSLFHEAYNLSLIHI